MTEEPKDCCAIIGDCTKCFVENCTCPHHQSAASELVEDLEEANAETPESR